MSRSAWDIIMERTTPYHVHACPVCYDDSPCTRDCTIEPDLERANGMPAGSHICCSKDCAMGNDSYLADAYEEFMPTQWQPPPEQLRFTFYCAVGQVNDSESQGCVTRSIV
jgi:hypothetical protein